MGRKNVYLISYDAFSEDDWCLAASLPNMSELIRNGSYTNQLKSVYPSLTYVAHTTMVTGMYPDSHGVFHNCPFQPFVDEKDKKWFWYKKDIKVPTIYDVVKNAGMKSAGILWPVTGKADITYNMPEIKAIGRENQAIKILKNGSILFCIALEKKYGRMRKGIEQPYLDDFSVSCAVDTIKNKRPDILMLHLIELDDAKHKYGTNSQEVKQAIINMDRRIGMIINAAKEAGTFNNTVFIIAGDHGQLDISNSININKIFIDNKLIYKENDKWKWRAYVQSAGGSAFLYIKQGDSEAELMVKKIFSELINDDSFGIENIFYEDEFQKLHVKGKFTAIIEAKKSYYFTEDLNQKKGNKATHGYSPDKPGYMGNLLISGNGISTYFELGMVNMTDIAPTIAAALGIDFPECKGEDLLSKLK